MALEIQIALQKGFAPVKVYARVDAVARKTKLAAGPRPKNEKERLAYIAARGKEAFDIKTKAGLTAEDIARRPARFNGQKTVWTSDKKRLADAAAVERDRAMQRAEIELSEIAMHDQRSLAVIELFASKEQADDLTAQPFDRLSVAFDYDWSDGAPNPKAQAYAAVKADPRFSNAKDV